MVIGCYSFLVGMFARAKYKFGKGFSKGRCELSEDASQREHANSASFMQSVVAGFRVKTFYLRLQRTGHTDLLPAG